MIEIDINLDENTVQRLDALCKFKNISINELIKELINKQLIIEEQIKLDKMREDIPIEFLLENFDA